MAAGANPITKVPVALVLLAVALTTIYPLVFVSFTAFRQNKDYLTNPYGLPSSWSFDNFVKLIVNYDVIRAGTNSFLVVLIGVALSVSFATLAAYAIVKLDLPLKKWFAAGFVSVMLVPSQVLIIPVYLLLSQLRLVDSLPGIAVVYIATTIPFGIFFMTTVLRAVPDELIEAAKIDGAGAGRALLDIVVPVARTGILTLSILTFLAMWNELLFGLILLPSESQNLLTPKMASIGGRFTTNQPVLMAGLMLTSLPPILVLTFLSKYLVSGIAAGIGK